MQAAAEIAREGARQPELSIPHGPFLVEADGSLHARETPSLRFTWRGRGCEARLDAGRMRLSAVAGAIPYTAESPGLRAGMLAALGTLPSELPPGWRLRLLPDHRLRLESETALPAPTTATALVGQLVGFALALDPYLDRLDSAGAVSPPSGAMPGMAKT
ncbi:hypothetical protein [Roseomonas sp. AR75]|jgi:hypothetical protein|uniref:hypothetical protein n=1 Tax=Roseomonas sp. AR75 TaxID=2562311 RepID=UPI0010BFFA2B|nr:hypothetical protein [Roseomonas sp. AR75]